MIKLTLFIISVLFLAGCMETPQDVQNEDDDGTYDYYPTHTPVCKDADLILVCDWSNVPDAYDKIHEQQAVSRESQP